VGVTLEHRAVAEKRERHAVGALPTEREGDAGRDRDGGADDGDRRQRPDRDIADVQRAAAAAAAACLASEQLGHQPARGDALGERLPVAAMGDGDPVVGSQRRGGSGGARLLAEREVDRPGQPPLQEQAAGALLERPDERHPSVQLDSEPRADIIEGDWGVEMGVRLPGEGHGRVLVGNLGDLQIVLYMYIHREGLWSQPVIRSQLAAQWAGKTLVERSILQD
jgi:hypothetical protein